jgi:hypothetical protein
MARIEPWILHAMSTKQVIAKIIDNVLATPSYTPPLLLALSGEEIMQNARDTAARSQLEISGALRRRG